MSTFHHLTSEVLFRSDKRGLKVFQALLLILRVLDTTVKHGWTMWNFSAPKSKGPRSQDVSSAIIPIQNTHTHFHYFFMKSRYPKSHPHLQDTLG